MEETLYKLNIGSQTISQPSVSRIPTSIIVAMLPSLAPILLLLHSALAAPVENAAAAAATVGKIRGVRDPIYHLYLQASSKNGASHHHPTPTPSTY